MNRDKIKALVEKYNRKAYEIHSQENGLRIEMVKDLEELLLEAEQREDKLIEQIECMQLELDVFRTRKVKEVEDIVKCKHGHHWVYHRGLICDKCGKLG